MSRRVHVTLSGHRVEYDPSPKLATFLTRLEDMISAPKVAEQEMIGLAYSRENPLMDRTLHPWRVMVTKKVFANPAYQVISDLLFRKRVALEKIDIDAIAATYDLDVAEAAKLAHVHPSAIRQAIKARRLASWVKDGKYFMAPNSLASFAMATKMRREKTGLAAD